MKKVAKFALGTSIAAGLGYVTGLLTAPKSGKETRKDIQDTAIKTKQDLEKKLNHITEELSELVDKSKTKLKGLETSAKSEMQKALDVAVLSKDKARDMLHSIQKGEADDKDLKSAITDVNHAIDNLKKYIKKNG